MSDPQRPQWSDPTQAASGYPPNPDPAYSGYWSQPTQYGAGYGGPLTQPTEQIPPYWQSAGYPAVPPPPEPPKKTPRWLWVAAAAAMLLVIGLVLALVIVSNSSRDTTVVAPPSTSTTPARPDTTSPRLPAPPATSEAPAPLPPPLPSASLEPTEPGLPPSEPPAPTGTETVVYSVSGEGRAINITYVDNGRVMQTEFNVALPWSKQVTLEAPAKSSASVAVVNVGRDVSCSITVNGAQIQQRTGRGLTVCTGAA
ncbi:MAG: MmpS family transport accessory protein [Mycobacterium sp.]